MILHASDDILALDTLEMYDSLTPVGKVRIDRSFDSLMGGDSDASSSLSCLIISSNSAIRVKAGNGSSTASTV